LKPVVCRRVVGRLPSRPLERSRMVAAGSKDPATYLVRSLGFKPESSISRLARSTKLSKTEAAIRLSGTYSVQAELLQEQIRLSSKPVKVTNCAGRVSTGSIHRISTGQLWVFPSTLARGICFFGAIELVFRWLKRTKGANLHGRF